MDAKNKKKLMNNVAQTLQRLTLNMAQNMDVDSEQWLDIQGPHNENYLIQLNHPKADSKGVEKYDAWVTLIERNTMGENKRLLSIYSPIIDFDYIVEAITGYFLALDRLDISLWMQF